MTKMQSQDCFQIVRMVYQPSLTICSSRDPYGTTLQDGRFPQEYLNVLKKVIHKENYEADAFLTP